MNESAVYTSENISSALVALNSKIAELNSTIELLQASVKEMESKNKSLSKEYESLKNDYDLLKEENTYLKRKLFGTKSETSRSLGIEQLSLFDEAEQECDEELSQEITYTRAKKRIKDERKIKFRKLKHVEELYTIPEEERVCSICGITMHRVGKEFVRSEIVFEPAKLYVKDIYRETYECRKCRKDNLVHKYKAGTPDPLIPHSYASASAVAQIMNDKFVNHMPLYRQEAEWKRLGLDLSRATMANWIIIASNEYLIPLVDRMHSILLKQSHIHCDETTIQVLNESGKKNTSNSYMWVYSSIKESENPIRIFEYHPDRSASRAQEFLDGFSGTIITDGYQGYGNIPDVTNAYCWAHVRRKFRDALPDKLEDQNDTIARKAIDRIAKLFAIEKKIEASSPEEKMKIRQKESKPLLDEFFLWCRKCSDDVLMRSKTGKALQYALKYENGLKEYVNDGLIPMTNSLDERVVRSFTIGRKNWLFAGSPKGAKASAAAFSIIETAKANNLNPYDYLEYLFEVMPLDDFRSNPENIDKYLPWSSETNEIFEK